MKNCDVTNFKELHDAVFTYKKVNESWIFRGQKDQPPEYELVPSIGREPYKVPDRPNMRIQEENLLDIWEKRAKDILRTFGNLSTIEILCLAQHHSCPTRLLDWTYVPLVAAYFAVREDWDSDSFIYCLNTKSFDKSNEAKNDDEKIDPFNITNDIVLYDPGSLTQQMKNQATVLTIHKDPTIPLTQLPNVEIEQITIKKDYRKTLLEELSFYNIHVWTMFPSLDGLGNRMAWSAKNSIERAQVYLANKSKP